MKLSISFFAALAVHSAFAAPPVASTNTNQAITSKPLTATSTPTVASSPNVKEASPCAVVSAKAEAALAADPEFGPVIPAEDAINCFRSVPINVTEALLLLGSISSYLEFQSTLEYLKNPPPGYPLPETDLIAGIGELYLKVEDGLFSNEYDFQTEISNLFKSAHDGHLFYSSDITTDVMGIARSFDLLSISVDGQQLPKVYTESDIRLSNADPSFIPSAVSAINGQEVVSFLEEMSLFNNIQDLDALYNNVFSELAQISIGQKSFVFSSAPVYPGPITTLTFQNGTSREFPNLAAVTADFDGVDNGEKFYKKFCTPSETTEAASPSSSASSTATPEPTAPLYPYPVVKHSKNLVGGYFLNGTDVAILSIPSFDAVDAEDRIEFQKVVQTFFAKCVKEGKQRLVIDLQANGGGKIILGYDTFKQLFPSLEPYGASTLRAHESANIIGQQRSKLDGEIPTDDLIDQVRVDTDEWYDFRASLDVNNKPYSSWKDVYGPVDNGYGNFTHLLRARNDWPVHTTLGQNVTITGYNDRSTGFTQPFLPQNIIMVTDGYCASTCSVFSEFMKQQAGVQSIALGGRPMYGPMQAVGGVKGAEATDFGTILQTAQSVLSSATPAQLDEWAGTSTLTLLNDIPILRSSKSMGPPGLNLRNNIRQNDATMTPLQFVYEAADCRLFWTADMVANITRVWEKAAEVAFGDAKELCVPGSTGHPSSVSGGGANSTNVLAGPGGNVQVFGGANNSTVVGVNGTVVGGRRTTGRRMLRAY